MSASVKYRAGETSPVGARRSVASVAPVNGHLHCDFAGFHYVQVDRVRTELDRTTQTCLVWGKPHMFGDQELQKGSVLCKSKGDTTGESWVFPYSG